MYPLVQPLFLVGTIPGSYSFYSSPESVVCLYSKWSESWAANAFYHASLPVPTCTGQFLHHRNVGLAKCRKLQGFFQRNLSYQIWVETKQPTLIYSFAIWFGEVSIILRAKSLQSCLTLCNPMDGRSPGSSVHGILRQEY